MDTNITEVKDGRDYNRYGQEVIYCRFQCGRRTTMTGTRECDPCHEAYACARSFPNTKAAFDAGLKGD